MKMILIAAGALAVGIALGVLYCESTYRHLRKRLRELRAGQERRNIIRSITRFLFVTAQVFAIVWVGMQIIAPPSVTITRPPPTFGYNGGTIL